jgi:hypothetical protein
MQFITGRIFVLFFLLLSFAIFYLFMRQAMKGKVRKMRTLAGLQAIPEAIGKAAETNHPVHYSAGTVGFSGGTSGYAAQTFAGLSVLSYVAQLTAKYKVPLYVTTAAAELIPVMEANIRESYTKENRVDAAATETQVIFFPCAISNAPYASGVTGLLERVRPAASIMIGAFYFEALMISEQGFIQGAMQIAGTAMTAQIAFFVAACDYTLIGEEIFVAGAVISQDTTLLGSIAGQDLVKAILIALLVGGFIIQNLGVNLLALLNS